MRHSGIGRKRSVDRGDRAHLKEEETEDEVEEEDKVVRKDGSTVSQGRVSAPRGGLNTREISRLI